MSMLAMATPTPHASFKKEYFSSWEDNRHADYASSRPRSDPERIALPSIRQAFPELHLRIVPQEGATSTPSSTTSPIVGPPGTMTPPEYVHSPTSQNKRRRLSMDEDHEERASRVPRLYSGPVSSFHQRRGSRGMSPGAMGSAPAPLRSATESWTSSSRTSPFLSGSASGAGMRSPVAMEPADSIDRRPTLPSLPMLNLERTAAPAQPMHNQQHLQQHQQHHQHHVRALSGDDYLMDQSRGTVGAIIHPNMHSMEAAGYRQGDTGYGYGYHPSRVQSLSLGSIHQMDRSPFSAGVYSPYPDYMRIGELGGMGLNGDNKQRKRRGNLPKETTDKLRAWFMAHLQHPYPTEDEKQELMRQTGLQMNQISNWFINARRRQLPTMINNARAETEAMAAGRVSDGKVLPSTERSDYDVDGKRSPMSDDGAMNFDDDVDMKRRRGTNMKRGSI